MDFKTKFGIGARVYTFNKNKLSEPALLFGHISKLVIQQDGAGQVCINYLVHVESRIPVLIELTKEQDCQPCDFFTWAYESELYDGLSFKKCRTEAWSVLRLLYETELEANKDKREPLAKEIDKQGYELKTLDSRIQWLEDKLKTLGELEGKRNE